MKNVCLLVLLYCLSTPVAPPIVFKYLLLKGLQCRDTNAIRAPFYDILHCMLAYFFFPYKKNNWRAKKKKKISDSKIKCLPSFLFWTGGGKNVVVINEMMARLQ